MSGAAPAFHGQHRSRHLPVADLDHALATASVVVGAVALVLVAVELAAAALTLGLVGMGIALVAQMLSRTRGERWVDMIGLLASFLAAAIAAAVLD